MKPWKIIVPLLVIALLAGAFWYGDGSSQQESPVVVAPETTQEPEVVPETTPELEIVPEVTEEPKVEPEVTEEPEVVPEVTPEPEAVPEVTEEPQVTPEVTPEPEVVPEVSVEPVPEVVPEVTPEPTCTLSIRCDTLLQNLDSLPADKVAMVPADGLIYHGTDIVFAEGESAFDVLLREMQRNKIHMEYSNTPIYNSAYIEGIANFYEFDGGPLSGWMYKVNGWFPNYGCSRYGLTDGDVIEFVFTCDLGADVGGAEAAGQQNEG